MVEPLRNRDARHRVPRPRPARGAGGGTRARAETAEAAALLALLLLHTGEVVSTDQLIEELWAGKPPKAAVGSLQNLVSALRKAARGRDRGDAPPGYRLVADMDRVDLHRFERLVGTAGETEDASGGRSCSAKPWLCGEARPCRPRLRTVRPDPDRAPRGATNRGARGARGRGAGARAARSARRRARGPGRRAPAARTATRTADARALSRGRQAEALEAYRDARETLVDELGIEPSPELQQLEQAILRHDQELDLPARVVAAPAEPDRRKTVTILFTDVVDSTGLGAALDPEVMRAVMSRYFDSVRTIVERHGGTVEKFIGDAAMAMFGIPQQHEDDALRAVRAAVELRQAITGLNADLERDHGVAIQIRSAINTGEVVAGHPASGEPFATGNAINVAMKLHESALPAEIVLGQQTQSLVHGTVTTEPVDEVEMGGTVGRVAAHRLVSLSETCGGPALPSRALRGSRRRACPAPAGFRAGSRGEPQPGPDDPRRSGRRQEPPRDGARLLLGDEARFVVGRCLSYGEGATYLPLAEIVRQIAPKRPRSAITSLLAGDEDAELIATRLTELTGEADGDGSTARCSGPPAASSKLSPASGRSSSCSKTCTGPSRACSTSSSTSRAGSRMRPYSCSASRARASSRNGRAGARSTQTIVLRAVVRGRGRSARGGAAAESDLPDALRARIVTAAEGNALFVEQLHAYLAEDVGATDADSVPPSIEALLASRLDALEPGERALIERAAVIGRDFARNAVMHLSPPDELAGIDSRLAALERRGLVRALRVVRARGNRSLPPRSDPRRRVLGDHQGAARRPPRAPWIMARDPQRAGRARGLPRRAGAPVPKRAEAERP